VVLEIDVRPSDTPLIDCVWRGRSTGVGRLNSIASSHWHLVVSEVGGQFGVSVHGPESRPVAASLPVEGTWVGIRFQLGVMLQDVSIRNLVDAGMLLPEASHRSFWWKGGTWERPTYENAEVLVTRLAREDLIGRDPLIEDALKGGAGGVSLRTLQRRFYLATGQARRAVRQIERARRAAVRLREGATPADVTHELGYYDQPHLTRATRRYLGRTPAELAHPRRDEQLSLLYKTDAAGAPTLTIDRLRGPAKAA
jgi:AraC-like DNA-binding protein